jgi:GNAT superfamily N-acetyltransferase
MTHKSYRLELRNRAEFRPKAPPVPALTLARAEVTQTALCRRLWTEVGRGFWTEREEWAPVRWEQHLADARVSCWIVGQGAATVGYFELHQADEGIKIEGFGLLENWRGRGLGGAILSLATEQAFALGGARIWLQTATDDHPSALPNYLKRGYRIYHEEALANPMSR